MKPRRTSRLHEPAAVHVSDAFAVDCSVCLPWYIKDEENGFCDGLSRAFITGLPVFPER